MASAGAIDNRSASLPISTIRFRQASTRRSDGSGLVGQSGELELASRDGERNVVDDIEKDLRISNESSYHHPISSSKPRGSIVG